MRVLTCHIPESESGRTVQGILERNLLLSRKLVRSLKWRPDGIQLNGRRVRVTERVAAGDVLQVQVQDRPGTGVFEPVSLPVGILYEDEDLLILDKPAGMAVHHGGRDTGRPSVGEFVAHHLGTGTVFHPVSRLDRGTSGVMCVAKSGYIHDRLRRVLHTDEYFREYLAVVVGVPSPPAGTVELGIYRDPSGSVKRFTGPAGAPSFTHYETLATCGNLSLLRVLPRTGRTHQIRVHLSAIGCPLAGDDLYGPASPKSPIYHRPLLHAWRLSLVHPVTGVRLQVNAPIPEDRQAWRKFDITLVNSP